MAQEFEIPAALKEGYVIEWIPRQIKGGQSWLKFHANDGQQISCQEIKNGCFQTAFDFLAFAQNIANQQGLTIGGGQIEDFDNFKNPLRCIIVNNK